MARASVRVVGGIAEVPREEWNRLVAGVQGAPFVDWRWLWAMEDSGCASARAGWVPRHLTLWRGPRLVAAAPGYLKMDSDGDFSRDFDLASAALRTRRRYYPKLVLGVPFTPVTGRRLLVAPDEERGPLVRALGDALRDLMRDEDCGTAQLLFSPAGEAEELAGAGFSRRVSHQFHWRNEGYREPGDFLARFTSKRRHMLKRERAAPAGQGLEIRTIRGAELASERRRWAHAAHALHSSTVEKLMWGRGWLNRGFYERIFEAMPEPLEIVAATRGGDLVAGAFNVATPTHLYGRYWGCFEEHPFLHFNVCYYHSVDECIRRGVQVFEGGAGGEHKLARGFLPAETHSAHVFADARLDAAFQAHLAEETREREAALAAWQRESPILRAGGAS